MARYKFYIVLYCIVSAILDENRPLFVFQPPFFFGGGLRCSVRWSSWS